MGFFSDDMAPMLGVYEAETSELIGTMDAIVSRVEREDAFTDDDIAELFRCAHTIKGSSAMMGLEDISTLTHRVEDLFDLLRGDPSLAEGRIPDMLDHLYAFSDYVKDEVARMEDPDFAPTDASALIDDVSAYAQALTGAGDAGGAEASPEAMDGPVPEGEPEEAAPSPSAGGTVLKVGFKPDVPMVNARALVILKQLATQVEVRSSVPDDLTSAQASQVIAQDGLLVVVDGADADKARHFLAKSSFIRRIDILDETAGGSTQKAATEAPEPEAAGASEKFVTIRWSHVQELQDMAGEFLLNMSRLRSLSANLPEESGVRGTVSKTTRLVDELVYRVNKMAMVSMSAMVPQLSRMVRDMCRNSGKQVSFEVHGGDIEIDRNLYNSIADPLLHIIRNAVDHGIEPPEQRLASGKEGRGRVTLSIDNLGARVAFRVTDDGRGIDTEAVLAKAEARGTLTRPRSSYSRAEVLQMVLLPGLSTSQEITQYSGRGVGMDVVNSVVRDFNGSVDIESEPGRGTSMTLFMPVSVTSVECLCFRIGPAFYHMPLFNLNKVYTASEAAERFSHFEGSTLFEYDKRQVPVLDMHRLLDCEGEDSFYVVCHSLDDEFVIGVDDVLGDVSCANKPLPSCLGPTWQGACPVRNVAIRDDGTVGYVLNSPLLADFAQGRKRPVELHDGSDGGKRSKGSAPGSGTLSDVPTQAFVFTLGSDWYALPVDEVERLSPMPIFSPVPRAQKHLIGLANHRNRAIAVFDLAGSAGVREASPYVLIVDEGRGEGVGLAITSAIGVRDLDGAVLADEQGEPRSFACGLRTTVTVRAALREPEITVLTRS